MGVREPAEWRDPGGGMPLLRRRIRSALYIDFENVKFQVSELSNLVAWLEDGMFDEKRRRRRFMQRRLYLNSQANKHRKGFEEIGFEVIEVERYGGLHNSADIRIAVDMIEAALLQSRIEEYILLSLDSDFVPVVQKLGSRGKRTVVMVDEHKSAAKTAFDLHADATIARRVLTEEAETYVRPRRGLIGRLRRRPVEAASTSDRNSQAGQKSAIGRAGWPVVPLQAHLPKPKSVAANGSAPAARAAEAGVGAADPVPRLAIDAFIKVAARNVGQPTARTSIMKELATLPGFAHNGAKAYFGFRSYKALVEAVAKVEPRIRVKPLSFGGIAVAYVSDGAAVGTDTAPMDIPGVRDAATTNGAA
jgi:uncharacterized LabA/DUF88 family protein